MVFIIILIFTLLITSLETYKENITYNKENDGTYTALKVKEIQPFNFAYNYENVGAIWGISLTVSLIFLYVCLKRRMERECNINIIQRIVLAIAIPFIVFTIALSTGENAWIFWTIILIIITIFEYDLFGNRKIILVVINFDFKMFIKIVVALLLLFFLLGILGYNIKPFKISSVSYRITESVYNLHQKD